MPGDDNGSDMRPVVDVGKEFLRVGIGDGDVQRILVCGDCVFADDRERRIDKMWYAIDQMEADVCAFSLQDREDARAVLYRVLRLHILHPAEGIDDEVPRRAVGQSFEADCVDAVIPHRDEVGVYAAAIAVDGEVLFAGGKDDGATDCEKEKYEWEMF